MLFSHVTKAKVDSVANPLSRKTSKVYSNHVASTGHLSTIMSKIRKKLTVLEFPESARSALQYVASCASSQAGGGIPGLSSGTENSALEVVQEFILFQHPSQRNKKLNAMQEMLLLEMIGSCLQRAQESRYAVFNMIFGGNPDSHKINLLTKLISLSLSIGNSAVLDCAGLWMQEQGCYNQPVCDMARKLVADYCLLFPDTNPLFSRLPSVSPLFTCNFITGVVAIYSFHDMSSCPPLVLLQYIVDWVSDDPCLCSESVRLVRIQSRFSCPMFGLFQWCTLGHFICALSNKTKSEPEKTKMIPLLSKLHFSILNSLQAYKSMELNQELFHLPLFVSLVRELVRLHQQHPGIMEEDEFQLLVERLGQVLQVAVVTKALHINPVADAKEIKMICELLPNSRLLQMVAHQWVAQPMDTS